MLVDTRLTMSQQHALAARKAEGNTGFMRQSIANRSREGTLPLCSSLEGPLQEGWILFWAPLSMRDVDVLERVQRRAVQFTM